MEAIGLVLAGAVFCGVFLVWPITRGYALAKKLREQQAQELAAAPRPCTADTSGPGGSRPLGPPSD